MKIEPYVTFDINPHLPCRVPKDWEEPSMRYKNFMRYLDDLRRIAKAKRFKLSDSFKIIFILPYKREDINQDGEPHLNGTNSVMKLVDGVRQALRPDGDIYRIDVSKYWGRAPKIIIKNLTIPDAEYLRQVR